MRDRGAPRQNVSDLMREMTTKHSMLGEANLVQTFMTGPYIQANVYDDGSFTIKNLANGLDKLLDNGKESSVDAAMRVARQYAVERDYQDRLNTGGI